MTDRPGGVSIGAQAARAEPRAPRPLAAEVFSAALDLVGRFGLMTVIGAVATLAITRLLGPTGYGSYASAIATVGILGATADLGFTTMLSRDAVGPPAGHRPMLRAAYEVAGAWSAILTMVLVGLAVSAGLSTDRGLVLLVLAPSMLFNGLNPARVFLIVTRRTRVLLLIDVVILIVQVAVAISVAAAGLGPVAVGVTVSGGSIVGNLIVSAAVHRVLAPGDDTRFSRRELLARSAPLGVASILTRVYLTIDLVLLGWLVSGPRLGEYAAAAKAVTVLAGVAGTIMSGALPSLSAIAVRFDELERLAARIWHWLMVAVLPAFVALVLFAAPVIKLALGHRYAHAAPLLQVLALAGCISVLSNLVGTLMVVLRKNRALVVQNTVAIVFNVVGNLILVPRIGVVGAAWMTVATEALVCLGSIIWLRGDLGLGAMLGPSTRPAVAIGLASAVAIPLLGSPVLAALGAAVAFLGVIAALGAWPREFRVRGLGAGR